MTRSMNDKYDSYDGITRQVRWVEAFILPLRSLHDLPAFVYCDVIIIHSYLLVNNAAKNMTVRLSNYLLSAIMGSVTGGARVAKTYQCSVQTHERILHCLYQMICENKAAPSIKSVCEQLAMTRGTFYLHFASMEAAREELDKTIGEKLKEAYTDYRKDHLKQKLLPHTFFIFEWLKKDLSYHRASLSSYPAQLRAVLDEVLSAMIDSDDPYVRCFLVQGAIGFLCRWIETDGEKAYEAGKSLDHLLQLRKPLPADSEKTNRE